MGQRGEFPIRLPVARWISAAANARDECSSSLARFRRLPVAGFLALVLAAAECAGECYPMRLASCTSWSARTSAVVHPAAQPATRSQATPRFGRRAGRPGLLQIAGSGWRVTGTRPYSCSVNRPVVRAHHNPAADAMLRFSRLFPGSRLRLRKPTDLAVMTAITLLLLTLLDHVGNWPDGTERTTVLLACRVGFALSIVVGLFTVALPPEPRERTGDHSASRSETVGLAAWLTGVRLAGGPATEAHDQVGGDPDGGHSGGRRPEAPGDKVLAFRRRARTRPAAAKQQPGSGEAGDGLV